MNEMSFASHFESCWLISPHLFFTNRLLFGSQQVFNHKFIFQLALSATLFWLWDAFQFDSVKFNLLLIQWDGFKFIQWNEIRRTKFNLLKRFPPDAYNWFCDIIACVSFFFLSFAGCTFMLPCASCWYCLQSSCTESTS